MSFSSFYIYLEPKWPLFLKVNPPKQGLFKPKQGSSKGSSLNIYTFQLAQRHLLFSRKTLSAPYWIGLAEVVKRIDIRKKAVNSRWRLSDFFGGGQSKVKKKPRNLVPNPQKWRKNTLPETNRKKQETENMPKLPKEGQILSNGFFWSQNVTRFKYRRLFVKNQRSTKKESAECSKWS